eukprot:Seg349.3 transcript_id=Seg349.3/GoldUCD/mRNA.D3Y31 product="Rhodopsin GQ-coupled" protein_id=Seg349.3/GoldUCD/D3Y31
MGNSTVLLIIYRDRNMRTPQYLLIANLACSDIGIGLATSPLTVATAFNQGEWALGTGICQYQAFANSSFFMVTMLTLMAMTMEKYFSIVRPLSRFVTRRRTQKFIAGAWILTFVIASFPLLGFSSYGINGTTQSCGIAYPKRTLEKLYLVMVLFLGFALPLCVMTIANARIFLAVRQHSKRLKKHAQSNVAKAGIVASQKHFTITVVIILVLFVTSWTPFFLLATVAEGSDRAEEIPPFLGVLAYWCGYAASAWNPIVYVTRNRRFRHGVTKILNEVLCKKSNDGGANTTYNETAINAVASGNVKRMKKFSVAGFLDAVTVARPDETV